MNQAWGRWVRGPGCRAVYAVGVLRGCEHSPSQWSMETTRVKRWVEGWQVLEDLGPVAIVGPVWLTLSVPVCTTPQRPSTLLDHPLFIPNTTFKLTSAHCQSNPILPFLIQPQAKLAMASQSWLRPVRAASPPSAFTWLMAILATSMLCLSSAFPICLVQVRSANVARSGFKRQFVSPNSPMIATVSAPQNPGFAECDPGNSTGTFTGQRWAAVSSALLLL